MISPPISTIQQDGRSTTEKLSFKVENVHPLHRDSKISSLSEKELDNLTMSNTAQNKKYLSANITVVVIRMDLQQVFINGSTPDMTCYVNPSMRYFRTSAICFIYVRNSAVHCQ
jgi:hypothetical protein